MGTAALLFLDIENRHLIIAPSMHEAITIPAANIQAISSLTTFLVLYDQIRSCGTHLRFSRNRDRALVIQYMDKDTLLCFNLCILEESESMKLLLTTALTALHFEPSVQYCET